MKREEFSSNAVDPQKETFDNRPDYRPFSHRSIGRWTPSARKGNWTFVPVAADW
jgi:hypothetical protein